MNNNLKHILTAVTALTMAVGCAPVSAPDELGMAQGAAKGRGSGGDGSETRIKADLLPPGVVDDGTEDEETIHGHAELRIRGTEIRFVAQAEGPDGTFVDGAEVAVTINGAVVGQAIGECEADEETGIFECEAKLRTAELPGGVTPVVGDTVCVDNVCGTFEQD